jgi:hypothetical protein
MFTRGRRLCYSNILCVCKSCPGNRVNIGDCVEQFVYSAGDLEFKYTATKVSAILLLSVQISLSDSERKDTTQAQTGDRSGIKVYRLTVINTCILL